jgi:hypothetical protein
MPARGNTKWRGLGAFMPDAGFLRPPGGRLLPWRPAVGQPPRSVGPGGSVGLPPTPRSFCDHAAPPAGCYYVPTPSSANPCDVQLICPPQPVPVGVKPPPSPPTGPDSTAGTPVPTGFPKNQFFVAPDGSVWEYSTVSNSWFNTGTPYSTGATPTGGGSGASSGASSAAPAPVSVSVAAPAAAESGYQSILNWLTQATLISPVPNWVVASGVVLLGYKFLGSGGKR